MTTVDTNKVLFIDKITQKRIDNWCHESDVALREMANQIKAETPNVRYALQDGGVYSVSVVKS